MKKKKKKRQVVCSIQQPQLNKLDLCRRRFNPWVGKIPWRRERQPPSLFLPGEFHGQKSLVDYSPRGSQRVGHDRAHACTHIGFLQCKAVTYFAAKDIFLLVKSNIERLSQTQKLHSPSVTFYQAFKRSPYEQSALSFSCDCSLYKNFLCFGLQQRSGT